MSIENPAVYPHRRRPIHLPVIGGYGRSVIIFLTICTKDRQPLLANPTTHRSLDRTWTQAQHWRVGRYVIMPDHIHLFCAPGTNPPWPLQSWVAYWKRQAAYFTGGTFWQKNFWDTQLRGTESYDRKWDYVRNNPVRAGLVSYPGDWPYQGELNSLRWHD
jgi:putative transposase